MGCQIKMLQQNAVSYETLFRHGLSKRKLTTSGKNWEWTPQEKNRHCGNYKKDKTIKNWFIDKRSQESPMNGVIVKEKFLEFAKALDVTECKASDCCLSKWKKR